MAVPSSFRSGTETGMHISAHQVQQQPRCNCNANASRHAIMPLLFRPCTLLGQLNDSGANIFLRSNRKNQQPQQATVVNGQVLFGIRGANSAFPGTALCGLHGLGRWGSQLTRPGCDDTAMACVHNACQVIVGLWWFAHFPEAGSMQLSPQHNPKHHLTQPTRPKFNPKKPSPGN